MDVDDSCLSLYAAYTDCAATQSAEACLPSARELQACYNGVLVRAANTECVPQLKALEECNRRAQPVRPECASLVAMLQACTVAAAHALAPHAGFQVSR